MRHRLTTSVIAIACVGIIMTYVLRPASAKQAASTQAAIMSCQDSQSFATVFPPRTFVVLNYDGSSGAPSIATDGTVDCASGIKILTDAGFSLQNSDTSQGTQTYVLTNP